MSSGVRLTSLSGGARANGDRCWGGWAMTGRRRNVPLRTHDASAPCRSSPCRLLGGCGGDDEDPAAASTAGSVEITTEIDFSEEPFSGTFEVTDGADALGCATGNSLTALVTKRSRRRSPVPTARETGDVHGSHHPILAKKGSRPLGESSMPRQSSWGWRAMASSRSTKRPRQDRRRDPHRRGRLLADARPRGRSVLTLTP